MTVARSLMRPLLLASLALGAASRLLAGVDTEASLRRSPTSSGPAIYAADFISTAASGMAMNEAGVVAGTSYVDTGCGSTCLPPQETVVWRGGDRIVLPLLPGFSSITVTSINAHGWVAGYAGVSGTTTHAAVWKPNGSGYDAIDLGALPGTTISVATGIDDLDRAIGWSTTAFFPPNGSPFLWSEATGMVDLSAQGYPDESPLALSPGGTVALSGSWYRLGDPASVTPLPPVPSGFMSGATFSSINDAGDQARFLVSTSTQNLSYLFRFHHEGTWQQLSPSGAGRLSPWGIGSINGLRDVSATLVGTGLIAYGPGDVAQTLAGRLSPAYQGAEVTTGGPITDRGEILARVMIGRSPRLMRLTPTQACTVGCIRVRSLRMEGRFIEDPSDPGHCTPVARNRVSASLEVTDGGGNRLAGVLVRGRFLDDYWMSKPVTGLTNQRGEVVFRHEGLACVGAVAFLVEGASKGARNLDRSTGVLTGYVIPAL